MVASTHIYPGIRFVEFSRNETEQSIVERFEKQAGKNPYQIAIQTGGVQLTYDDLNQSANRLARVLLLQSDDARPVAILMEHGAPAVVTTFGALKASKIFILLDPAVPDARIGQILDDSGSNLIVTNDQNLRIAEALLDGDRRIVNVDRCDTALDTANVNLQIPPDNISHILYTSGSTGRPKGVIRTHRNDLHNIRNRTNSFCISGDDHITLLGSFSTGQGMTDIYSALLNGATLFPRNLKREGFSGLAEWLMHERITIYHSATTLFRHFVGELSNEEIFPQLRIVNIGGEPVTWRDVELYKKRFSEHSVLVNELSCSEASTFGQFFVNQETEITVTVPVGYPVADKDILILDEKNYPVRTGDIGEIAICSQFLSPGYWNRPDLTALVFSPDPQFPARRIYRTGDIGRQSADGCLEYFGRKDARVKVRGYRVECYEIELALLHNRAVDQAFVTHRQDPRDGTQLIAYLVCAKGRTPTVSDLRADLVARLPEYMVPAAFVFIDALPLTPTGKIDRSTLPEPSKARPPLDSPFVTPRDSIEQSIAELCSQALRGNAIGIHDNLFELGGNSLLAMQIVSRVTKTFGVDVPLDRFYETPTIAGLRAIIATHHNLTKASADLSPSPAPREGYLPLSCYQERLWFIEQWNGKQPIFNLCQAFRLRGPLNVQAIEESLNIVISRHEILRASFVTEDGTPSQIYAPVLHLSPAILDLRSLPETEINMKGVHVAQEEARRPFDLAQNPLLRALLLRLANEDHFLILTVHQLVCDGWSMRILLSELWTSYHAICGGEAPSFPSPIAQYSDFVIWQRRLLDEVSLQSQITFWKETLSGDLPVLALPSDYPRPAVESFQGAKVSVILPESLTDSLIQFGRQEDATLFMTLMAALKILLYRRTGQEESLVGFPIANRHWGEATGSIGFFVNTLVARTSVAGTTTFRDFLHQVKEVCHAAYGHQELPFEKLVDILRPPRDLSRNPIFQAMFTFQNMPSINAVPKELHSTTINIDNGTAKVDLTLSLAERENQLIGFFEYSTDLFHHDTIERMACHYRTLLEAVVADPDQPIAIIPILTDAERHQILIEWNDTASDYPKHKCIHRLFEEQVERTPDTIALEFEDKQVTYRELNRKANQLAHHLIGLGIGQGKLVGICIERSIELVVGLLGILKAGGAYVPLDPSYPAERLSFMLEDSQVSVLLTTETLVEDRGWRMDDGDPRSSILYPRLQVVHLDRDLPTIEQQSAENPTTQIDSDNLAYVIYTSGSTGQPKGVQIEHRSVVNCLCSIGREISLSQHDAWLAVTTISFDIAGLELYSPLITGAKLVLASKGESSDSAQLLARLKGSRATVMQATPSLWKLLVETGWESRRGFKILCGGEALSRQLADQLLKQGHSVWNLYGPTESTIWSTMAKLAADEKPISIGHPIANTQIYILDAHLQPAPIGIPGDLYIGGDGLARGYLNRPELTSEKFVASPFNGNPHSRLYRTGDRAKYLADGNIEFLGRDDNQVKIRGHRIELGEIEAALVQHSAVNESVILARDRDSSGEKELVAYIVSAQEATVVLSDLRRFLQAKLPDSMIPSLFVFLDSLPLTPNGKIDRNALPPPDGERPQLDQGFVEPRTEIEELIAQIWREILKLDKIGIHDNFFELGGHSLLATRVVARLQSNFHVDLALRKLFELPTVAGLAQHIDALRRTGAGTVMAPIVPVSRDKLLALSFSQRRLWYLQKVDTNLSAYNIPAAFRVKGDLDSAALGQALNEMIARHEVLRSYVKEVDGQPRQEILPSLRMELRVIDLTHLPEEDAETEARRLSITDARQLYDLASAPLMRATLVKLAKNNHVFILNFHHIIADGSSLAIFYKEFAALYSAQRDGKTASLPSLPVQYTDYAAWQQEWLNSPGFATQLNYWQRQLANLPEPVALPTDFDRPFVQNYHGARLTRQLSADTTVALKNLNKQQSVTTFMTLFATFNILLSRITGHEDIVMGSTIAGRNHPETDGLIGFFINALPLRLELSGDPSFVALLKRARDVCLDAYTNQDTPFEKIVEALRPPREPGRNPIFDILFNIADASERALTLAGCQVTKLTQVDPTAKFDLVLHAPEVDGKIELAVVYNTELFRERRITTLLEQFAALLAQVVDNPELPIGQLSLVTDASRTVLPDPKEALDDSWQGAIHELLADQAHRAPAQLAVVDPDQSWAYADLDRCANWLANSLIASGIERNDLIAIYAQRSSSLVVALFGILKASASFLILDPAYPVARSVDYLRIAQPKGWLQLEGSGELPDELLNCLDDLHLRCRMNVPRSKAEILDNLSAFAGSEPATMVTAKDPAYVAITSGSTGEPKGVVCRHGPITHFLSWQKDAFQLSKGDRFAMLSGLAYSHLHRDVFTALSLGATLYIPNPSEARSPESLNKWLDRNAITVLHLTPALGQLLFTSGDARLPSVRRVFFGGDILTYEMVASVRQLAPNATVGSFYGATETQRAVGYFEIANDSQAAQVDAHKTIPLGRGIKDVQLLVLNGSQQLAGIGELGEIFVRSPHLAEGYIGDEKRTRQMFIVNPFTNNPNDRLYRTGELARYLPDGNVELAGRNDRRVNIRGFRVEPQEIEIALKRHPTVKDAAVVVRDYEIPAPEHSRPETRNPKVDQRLVAYVAADEEPRSLADLLQSYLTTRLPHYMVPAHYVILPSLPLSPNGKVDYRALPAAQFPAGFEGITTPRNEVEARICAVFAELLGRASVGIDENFFRIGGHSLLAARAAVRIADAFGVNLDLSTFLQNPTVVGLAKKVDSLRTTGQTITESDKDQREEFDL